MTLVCLCLSGWQATESSAKSVETLKVENAERGRRVRRASWTGADGSHRRRAGVFIFVSSADVAEPSSDLSHDFVDLECLQKDRFPFQLCTPCHQDSVHSGLHVIAFISNPLDGHLPFLKTHRLFFLEFSIGRFDRRDDITQPKRTRIAISRYGSDAGKKPVYETQGGDTGRRS
jgi:hypothetical protein